MMRGITAARPMAQGPDWSWYNNMRTDGLARTFTYLFEPIWPIRSNLPALALLSNSHRSRGCHGFPMLEPVLQLRHVDEDNRRQIQGDELREEQPADHY